MLKPRDLAWPRASRLWVLGQAGLVLLLICFYFGIRGLTVGSTEDAVDHAHDIVALEERLHLDIEDALQTPASDSETVVTIANWVYIWGHWPIIIVTMIWLLRWHSDVFRRLRDAMMLSGGVGMVIYATYPVAPPRLAGLGLIDTVSEQSQSYRVLQPPAFVNQYAAMPSLHAGWDLLVGISIVTASSTFALRVIGYAMPTLMAVAVVLTANHYVLDVVAGVALVLLAHAGALGLERRRHRLQSRQPEVAVSPGGG
ncbi:phosphatase PAP2 family protein [Aeromicrobium sp.]|uniref:phosphatase PAP2 family protein n=1 Tax=Aeromicrobium sp. TaxID=1871063 RepID=UPI002FC7877E